MTKKVLIVDDEPNILLALEYLLHRSGYEVHVASNGEDALREIEAFRPDVVLLDVMMPQQSGYDVCRRVRDRPELRGVKIVMLSAKGREAEVSKGLALGADMYVTKPFSNAELVARIGELLAERGAPGA
jgi:two-component system, OmpR family, alkaline phosphatase synthesis response regulator PhoP